MILCIHSGHNGNGILTPDEDHGEDGRSGEEEVIEIDESNSSVIGERRPESSLKSEVSAAALVIARLNLIDFFNPNASALETLNQVPGCCYYY